MRVDRERDIFCYCGHFDRQNSFGNKFARTGTDDSSTGVVMRLILILALVASVGACTAFEPRSPEALRMSGNGGCYLGNGVYSGARCPAQHP